LALATPDSSSLWVSTRPPPQMRTHSIREPGNRSVASKLIVRFASILGALFVKSQKFEEKHLPFRGFHLFICSSDSVAPLAANS
jgi:hypothetical protein